VVVPNVLTAYFSWKAVIFFENMILKIKKDDKHFSFKIQIKKIAF